LWLAVLILAGWSGATAFIGRFRANQVSRVMAAIAPPDTFLLVAIGVTLLMAIAAALAGRRAYAGAAAMITAFLVGHQLYAWLYVHLPGRFVFPFSALGDGPRFALSRLGYAATLLVPMLIAWFATFQRDRTGWPPLTFRIGKLTETSRDFSIKTPVRPVWRELLGGYGFFCVVMFIVMQLNVGFRPIVNGTFWALLPAILVAAVGNAIAEEFVFRGLIQPAFIRAAGVGVGLWSQGVMFGLMHWGVSVGVLAALPVSLLIGLGSVVWGKTALDTQGLGYVVIAHAMIDVCVMSAFFIR